MKIVINAKYCYGCRTCELICSFHHTGAFSPESSSIEIKRNEGTGEIKCNVDSTCDFCKEEKNPLCVKHCFYGAIKVEK